MPNAVSTLDACCRAELSSCWNSPTACARSDEAWPSREDSSCDISASMASEIATASSGLSSRTPTISLATFVAVSLVMSNSNSMVLLVSSGSTIFRRRLSSRLPRSSLYLPANSKHLLVAAQRQEMPFLRFVDPGVVLLGLGFTPRAAPVVGVAAPERGADPPFAILSADTAWSPPFAAPPRGLGRRSRGGLGSPPRPLRWLGGGVIDPVPLPEPPPAPPTADAHIAAALLSTSSRINSLGITVSLAKPEFTLCCEYSCDWAAELSPPTAPTTPACAS